MDLGAEGVQHLREIEARLGTLARELCMTGLRPRTRGEVIRRCLSLMIHVLNGDSEPLGKTIFAPRVFTDDTLRRLMGNTQGR